jgi:competence protein CoiA
VQLYANDEQGHLVWAGRAAKQCNYFCLECGSLVRLRGGLHRQNHFFHLEPQRSCHQSGKSMRHLQVQCALQRLLPQGEAQLEQPFPAINRIADVVWFPHRFIFEIQCSPISLEELEQRNLDYQKIGYQVIWIFHDQQFNRRRISAAEQAMRGLPHYFTNIDAEGNGFIYDQYDLSVRGVRRERLPPLPVDLSRPHYLTVNECSQIRDSSVPLPKVVTERLQRCQYYFEGDLVSCSLNLDLEGYCEKVLACEAAYLEEGIISKRGAFAWIGRFFQTFIVTPYRILFQVLLERASQ